MVLRSCDGGSVELINMSIFCFFLFLLFNELCASLLKVVLQNAGSDVEEYGTEESLSNALLSIEVCKANESHVWIDLTKEFMQFIIKTVLC